MFVYASSDNNIVLVFFFSFVSIFFFFGSTILFEGFFSPAVEESVGGWGEGVNYHTKCVVWYPFRRSVVDWFSFGLDGVIVKSRANNQLFVVVWRPYSEICHFLRRPSGPEWDSWFCEDHQNRDVMWESMSPMYDLASYGCRMQIARYNHSNNQTISHLILFSLVRLVCGNRCHTWQQEIIVCTNEPIAHQTPERDQTNHSIYYLCGRRSPPSHETLFAISLESDSCTPGQTDMVFSISRGTRKKLLKDDQQQHKKTGMELSWLNHYEKKKYFLLFLPSTPFPTGLKS